jgi:hypothetical protein
VAWGALATALVLAVLALRLAAWRRRIGRSGSAPVLDLTAAETERRAEALAFDGIVGHLLLTDPSFADSADRMARRDEPGPGA